MLANFALNIIYQNWCQLQQTLSDMEV